LGKLQLSSKKMDLRRGCNSRKWSFSSAEHQILNDCKAAKKVFVIRQSGVPSEHSAFKPHGAMLSGETAAALEFLCEQLPGTLGSVPVD